MAKKEKKKRKTLPPWQKGRYEFEVTLPAHRTKSGKEEKAKFVARWEVRATKPMTSRGRTKWEMTLARDLLERGTRALKKGDGFTNYDAQDLRSALTHAIAAWCRTHLRGSSSSDWDNFSAFSMKAPDAQVKQVLATKYKLRRLDRGEMAPAEAVEAVGLTVKALLKSASRPPRSRRRFPARLRAGRPILKPRVRPGGWIDTGRFRPAEVLSMMPNPPHTMTLSYGDDIDEDFRPHIVDWKTVRKRKRAPSLKDVFSPGEWIRHFRFGYGLVKTVNNTAMVVAFNGVEQTLVPDKRLSKIEKVDEPMPDDTRPASERFPPGTWIEQDSYGVGVVLAVDGDTLTVLTPSRLVSIDASPKSSVVWKLNRLPLDLTLPRVRRTIWWRHYDIGRGSRRIRACCGYPNLGEVDEFDIEPVQCIICGWTDQSDDEDDADSVRPVPDPNDPLDFPSPNAGYSLTEARRNFEARGNMFRPNDAQMMPFSEIDDLRKSLVIKLEEFMAKTPNADDSWNDIESLRRQILGCLYVIAT